MELISLHDFTLMEGEEIPSITTGGGDKGYTRMGNGDRVPKDSPLLDLEGTIDELNSYIGLCACHTAPEITEKLQHIQNVLFEVGACIACSKDPHQGLIDFIKTIEKWGYELEKKVPPFECFILPGGDVSSAHLHVARTICRRAERLEVKTYLNEKNGQLFCQILNRLSDFLFLSARYQNVVTGKKDIPFITTNPNHQK